VAPPRTPSPGKVQLVVLHAYVHQCSSDSCINLRDIHLEQNSYFFNGALYCWLVKFGMLIWSYTMSNLIKRNKFAMCLLCELNFYSSCARLFLFFLICCTWYDTDSAFPCTVWMESTLLDSTPVWPKENLESSKHAINSQNYFYESYTKWSLSYTTPVWLTEFQWRWLKLYIVITL
jgi:hypothetical protein